MYRRQDGRSFAASALIASEICFTAALSLGSCSLPASTTRLSNRVCAISSAERTSPLRPAARAPRAARRKSAGEASGDKAGAGRLFETSAAGGIFAPGTDGCANWTLDGGGFGCNGGGGGLGGASDIGAPMAGATVVAVSDGPLGAWDGSVPGGGSGTAVTVPRSDGGGGAFSAGVVCPVVFDTGAKPGGGWALISGAIGVGAGSDSGILGASRDGGSAFCSAPTCAAAGQANTAASIVMGMEIGRIGGFPVNENWSLCESYTQDVAPFRRQALPRQSRDKRCYRQRRWNHSHCPGFSRTQPSTMPLIICVAAATSTRPSPSRGRSRGPSPAIVKPPSGRRMTRTPITGQSKCRASRAIAGFALQRRPKNVMSTPREKC